MTILEKLKDLLSIGWSSGDQRGPRPGDGAVLHDSSGNADFDGLPGDALPPRKREVKDQLHPHERASD